MALKQSIQFLRSETIYTSKTLALAVLDTVAHKVGQPVMVRYNDGTSENPKIILALGIVDGVGASNYRLLANAYDLSILANYAQTTNTDLTTHTSNSDIHVTSADKTKWDGYSTSLSEISESLSDINNELKGLSTVISGVDNKIGELSSLTTTSKTNVVSAVNEIKSGLTSLTNTSYKGVKSGNGVDVSPIVSGEQTISVKVNSTDKILGVTAGGLDATVGLTYSNGVITLTGKSGVTLGTANIGVNTVVKSGSYDSTKEELVLVLNTNEEIRIPVGSLITEWSVSDTNNITLSKTRVVNGSDVLTADVKIDSSKSDNALKTSVNGLYVKDYVSDIQEINNKLTQQLADISENGVDITLSDNEVPEKLVSLKSLDGEIEKLKGLVGDTSVNTLITNIIGGASTEYNTLGKIENIVKSIQTTSSNALQNVVAGTNITVNKNGTSVTVNADVITTDSSSTTKTLSAKAVSDEIAKIGALVNGGLTMDVNKKFSVNIDNTSIGLESNKLKVLGIDGGTF